MFLKYANTRAQVLRHFGVGTWKQGKKLEIFSCSAFRPDASGMRSDASELRHRTRKLFSHRVRCAPSGEVAFSVKLSEFASGARVRVSVRCKLLLQSSLGVSPVHTGPSGVCVRCGDRCWLKFTTLTEFGFGAHRTRPVCTRTRPVFQK